MTTTPKTSPEQGLEINDAGYPAFIRKLFNISGDPSKDFTHAILGVVTEIREYQNATDDVNAIEEVGDLLFYIGALTQVVGDHTGRGLSPDKEGDVEELAEKVLEGPDPQGALQNLCNELLDHAKRWVGYEKEPKDLLEVMTQAAAASVVAVELGRFAGRSGDGSGLMEHAIAVNMAKLLKRYPGGDFDKFRATVRDLEGERAVLESAHLG